MADSLTAKLEKAIDRAANDAQEAGESRIIYLWYSAFLNDFTPTMAYASDNRKPKSTAGALFIRQFQASDKEDGTGVDMPNTVKRCIALKKSFNEKESDEYKHTVYMLDLLTDSFPANYGNNGKCKPLYSKIAEIALELNKRR